MDCKKDDLEQMIAEIIDLKCRVRDPYKMFEMVERLIESTNHSAQRDQLINQLIWLDSENAEDHASLGEIAKGLF